MTANNEWARGELSESSDEMFARLGKGVKHEGGRIGLGEEQDVDHRFERPKYTGETIFWSQVVQAIMNPGLSEEAKKNGASDPRVELGKDFHRAFGGVMEKLHKLSAVKRPDEIRNLAARSKGVRDYISKAQGNFWEDTPSFPVDQPIDYVQACASRILEMFPESTRYLKEVTTVIPVHDYKTEAGRLSSRADGAILDEHGVVGVLELKSTWNVESEQTLIELTRMLLQLTVMSRWKIRILGGWKLNVNSGKSLGFLDIKIPDYEAVAIVTPFGKYTNITESLDSGTVSYYQDLIHRAALGLLVDPRVSVENGEEIEGQQ